MAKVSIIIPTYNVEPYLVECMDSITNQTLKDIEIICINDGSTDNSLEILKSYAEKDSRIILVDKENGGYGIGMNIGLDKATGEYVGILEPDDFVPINMYEDLYNIASKNDLDFVKADFYRFTRADDGNMNLVYNHLSKNEEDYNKVFNPSETPSAIRYIMNTWSGIYKRSFLEEHGIRHNETPGASFQDNGFWFQTFVFAKRAMILNKPYYMNRRDNPNSSVKNPQKVYCMNVEYDHIRDILMKHPDLWERFKGMYWVKKLHNYNATLNRISEEFKVEYVDRISEEFARAKTKGELDQSLFTEREWDKITLLISSPKGFYNTYVVAGASNEKLKAQLKETKKELKATKKELAKTKKQLKKVKNSVTYKIGRIFTFIPSKIKRLFKRK
ncbi:MAG: glycosyltransferase [Lachnospiraceae bacterium]|nr:glycosyltransferase [Lachnospiraceae bacterium]